MSLDDVVPLIQALPTVYQRHILQGLQDLIRRPIIAPDIVTHGKGRPVGALGKTYNAKHSLQDLFDIANDDGTTKRFKSAYELADVGDKEVSFVPSSIPPPPLSQHKCRYCKQSTIPAHDARNYPVRRR